MLEKAGCVGIKKVLNLKSRNQQEGKDARKGGLRRYQEGFEFEVQKQKKLNRRTAKKRTNKQTELD